MFRPDYFNSYPPAGLKLLLTSVAPKEVIGNVEISRAWKLLPRWSVLSLQGKKRSKITTQNNTYCSRIQVAFLDTIRSGFRSVQTSEKSERAEKWRTSEKRREKMEKGRVCKHLFKYRNQPTTTFLVKNRFSCQNVICQNVKKCGVGLCARRQMRSNCHNWPIIAEWGIENNAYKSVYANSFSTRSWSL